MQDEFLGTFTLPLPPLQPPKGEPPGQRATSKAGFSSLSEGSGRAGVGMRLCPVPVLALGTAGAARSHPGPAAVAGTEGAEPGSGPGPRTELLSRQSPAPLSSFHFHIVWVM